MAATRRRGTGVLGVLALSVVSTVTVAARADDAGDARAGTPPGHATRLGLLAAAGYLGSPGAEGGAFLTGLRLGVDRHFAASVDLGYGLLRAAPATQDRWWLVPAASLVIPVRQVRLDVGAGVGVGTSSGYVSWSDYAARPFTPIWHYTVPAARAHLVAAMDLTPSLELFARVDVASLFTVASQASATDTTWFALWFGVQPRLL